MINLVWSEASDWPFDNLHQQEVLLPTLPKQMDQAMKKCAIVRFQKIVYTFVLCHVCYWIDVGERHTSQHKWGLRCVATQKTITVCYVEC